MRPEPVEGQLVRFDRRRPELVEGLSAHSTDWMAIRWTCYREYALILSGRQARRVPAHPTGLPVSASF